MGKRSKLAKQIRKGARALIGSTVVQKLIQDLVRTAVVAAAVKLRNSAAAKGTAEKVKAKAQGAAAAAGLTATPAPRKPRKTRRRTPRPRKA